MDEHGEEGTHPHPHIYMGKIASSYKRLNKMKLTHGGDIKRHRADTRIVLAHNHTSNRRQRPTFNN